MTNGFRLLRLAAPIVGCAFAAGLIAVSPTLAQQDWQPAVASTTQIPAQRFDMPVTSQGWEPRVLAKEDPGGFGPATMPDLVGQGVRRATQQQPILPTPQLQQQPQIAQRALSLQSQSQPQMPQPVEAERQPEAVPQASAQPAPAPLPPALPGSQMERVSKVTEAGPGQQYCINISDAAADARFAWQKKTLGEIEQELDRRIELLEKRTAEYRDWLERRDEFARKAQETLVQIFAKMRPDAAASQLVEMDEETAAAVLTKLNPRNASAILSEMPAAPAARLQMTIAGAGRVTPDLPDVNVVARGGKS